MTLVEFARWTSYLGGAAEIVFLAQLLRYRLASRYYWLFGYFLADLLQTLLVIRLPTSSDWYGHIYVGGQAVKALLGVGIATGLWKLALLGYPAVARVGRQIVIYMLLAAMLISGVGLLLEPAAAPGQTQVMHSILRAEGAVDSMVLAFLVVAVLFLLWFPLKMRRNVAVCIAAFAFYMFHRWALLRFVNLNPADVRVLSAVMVVLSLACLVLWTLALQPEGENVTTTTGHGGNPKEAERILGQLAAINERLERMTK
jgi:hypothetical protein